ncbi:MAG: hypothetical protein D6732_06045 [Methanobacteriota archaeon]|nr:MAG: hypothetical protein D6732_06045 [Euryarchaeota archaeon]
MKTHSLIILLCLSVIIPPKASPSLDIPVLNFFEEQSLTLQNGSVFEAYLSFPEFNFLETVENMEVYVNNISGNGIVQFTFLTDEQANFSDVEMNSSTFLYEFDGTKYFQGTEDEYVAIHEFNTSRDKYSFKVIRKNNGKFTYIDSADIYVHYKMIVRYLGEGTATFNFEMVPLNQIDLITYDVLHLTSDNPTVLNFIGKRNPLNLTIGLTEPDSLNSNLTIVWTTMNITSDMTPKNFMENPFFYDSDFTGNSVAYNNSSGISLVKNIIPSINGSKVFLDHPYFVRTSEYSWNKPYEATPFHLLFFSTVSVTIWIRLTTFLDDGIPTLLNSNQMSTIVSSQIDPLPLQGLFFGLFLFIMISKRLKKEKMVILKNMNGVFLLFLLR